MKVQAESFHLNGHIIGFRPQTQKLESPYKTPSSTLAVKGLAAIQFGTVVLAVEIDEPTTKKILECGTKEKQLSLILVIIASCLIFPINIAKATIH